VVAAYNEAAVISHTLENLRVHYKNVVVCDDCSTDSTAELAFTAGAHVLSHPINLGQGAALQTGISFAVSKGADYVVTFDADGQHNANEIAPMLAKMIDSKASVALGSRFLTSTSEIPTIRRLVLKFALLFTTISSNIKLTDVHNGLRILSRSFCLNFEFKQNRMAHASEILDYISKNKIDFIEFPVTVTYTAYSIKKGQKSSNAIRVLLELIQHRVFK
jgi:glycosyltransferase involved in cell wall biosynthesis